MERTTYTAEEQRIRDAGYRLGRNIGRAIRLPFDVAKKLVSLGGDYLKPKYVLIKERKELERDLISAHQDLADIKIELTNMTAKLDTTKQMLDTMVTINDKVWDQAIEQEEKAKKFEAEFNAINERIENWKTWDQIR